MSIRLIAGDCRFVLPTLAADSVQCVVCSPPYYGLRDYGTALWDGGDAACDHEARANRADRPRNGLTGGLDTIEAATIYRDTCGKCGAVRIDRQIGLERDPETYLATMVAVFREVRRVLRPDGTCWVNMGDSYASNGASGLNVSAPSATFHGGIADPRERRSKTVPSGLKPKDLLLMPARLALALQADGWWVRSAIVWAKPNPMPESCRDRPTSAYEMVYLLTKRARYYYDADAVREAETSRPQNWTSRVYGKAGGDHRNENPERFGPMQADEVGASGRNLRNVWTLPTHPYIQAHFATYPPELAERCIRAGTSERGACSQCGKPWVRVVEKPKPPRDVFTQRHAPTDGMIYSGTRVDGVMVGSGQKLQDWLNANPARTTGWAPGCKCEAAIVPCTVLDPFAGAGTTLLVADRLQRDAIGIELNTAYTEMAMERCRADAPLFVDMHPPPAEDPEDERMRDLFAEAE